MTSVAASLAVFGGYRPISFHILLLLRHLERHDVDFVLVRINVCSQSDVVPFMPFYGVWFVMVQLLLSVSLTKVLPSSLILPVT